MTNTSKTDPVADREIKSIDNGPPEALPQQLASAAEIPAMIKADVDAATERAVFQLDTYSRVPDVIENDEIYQRATTLAAKIKEVLDQSEDKRKAHKAPYLDASTLIDESFKLKLPAVGDGKPRQLKKELEAAGVSIKNRLSARDTALYLKQQEEEDAERAKLQEQAAADGIEMAPAAADTVIASTVKSAHGGQSVRNVVTEWSVVDEALLPRSVLSIDPAKIQKLIDGGATEIPGIKLEKKVKTHVKKR